MEFVGRKVKIELQNDSLFEGFLHSVDATLGKLTLEKVVCTDEDGEKTKLYGLQNIFNHEIANIVVTEEAIKSKSKDESITDRKTGYRDRCIMKPKIPNAHLDRLGVLNPKLLTLKNNRADDGMTSSGNEDASSSTEQEDIISHPDYTVIAKLNSVFYDAVQHITKHLVIGIAMEGVSLGRSGKLCWLQISVPDHVIVFDILKLGQAAFDDGLKDILEAETILKVFHDCRMVSDIMYHQYDVNLVNVFDTQVASAFVYRLRHHNDWPRHVDGLASCLIDHLNLSQDQVNWAVIRDGFREADEEVWLERPVKRNLIAALVKNVIHLLDLRQVLMDKMMEEYVAGVNIYLSHVRDASQGDIERYQISARYVFQRMTYLLPSAFQDIKRFMTSYHSRNPFHRRDNAGRDVNGFRENYAPIRLPYPKLDPVLTSLALENIKRMTYLLPSAFQDIKRFMTSYHTRNPFHRRDNAGRDVNGFRENYAPIRQPNVMFSKDSLWKTHSMGSPQKSGGQSQEPKRLQRYAAQISHLMTQSRSGQPTDGSQLTEQQPGTGTNQTLGDTDESSNTVVGSSSNRLSDLLRREQGGSPINTGAQVYSTDHVSEVKEMINRERDMKAQTLCISQGYTSDTGHQSTQPSVSPSQQGRDVLSRDSEGQNGGELSSGSLMRTLINQQAPPGAEENPELDDMMLTPAGRVIQGSMKKKKSPPTTETNRISPIPFAKRLIEKEIEIKNRQRRPIKHRYVDSFRDNEIPSDLSENCRQQTEEKPVEKYEKKNYFPWKSWNSDNQFSNTDNQKTAESDTKPQFVVPKMSNSHEHFLSQRTISPNQNSSPEHFSSQRTISPNQNSSPEHFSSQRTISPNQNSSSDDERVIPSAPQTTSPVSARLQALMNAMKA